MSDSLSSAPAPAAGSKRARDDQYYELLAGGAKTRLLEGFLDLELPELLGKSGPLSAAEICRSLSLHPQRAWKFLHLLSLVGLIERTGGDGEQDNASFALSARAKHFFGDDGSQGYYLRDLLTYWRSVACLPLVDVLRGMELPDAVRWPPPGLVQAEHLETWMRVTADGALTTLTQSDAMRGGQRLLDVGGGDGTIGCALAEQYPDLQVTVFNLSASAYLALRNIANQKMGDRVSVQEGDFLTEELPRGFDRILFSRVLCDWTPDVCRMLFEKSRRALHPGGKLIINEALIDGNLDYTVSWEFRYLFYDTFGRVLFKTLAMYEQLLAEAQFQIVKVSPMRDDAFYSVIEAQSMESGG